MTTTHRHPHAPDLDDHPAALFAHLVLEHDYQELAIATDQPSTEEMQQLHHNDHHGPPNARGLFQWIRPTLTPLRRENNRTGQQ